MTKLLKILAWGTVILATIQFFTERIQKEGLIPEKEFQPLDLDKGNDIPLK